VNSQIRVEADFGVCWPGRPTAAVVQGAEFTLPATSCRWPLVASGGSPAR